MAKILMKAIMVAVMVAGLTSGTAEASLDNDEWKCLTNFSQEVLADCGLKQGYVMIGNSILLHPRDVQDLNNPSRFQEVLNRIEMENSLGNIPNTIFIVVGDKKPNNKDAAKSAAESLKSRVAKKHSDVNIITVGLDNTGQNFAEVTIFGKIKGAEKSPEIKLPGRQEIVEMELPAPSHFDPNGKPELTRTNRMTAMSSKVTTTNDGPPIKHQFGGQAKDEGGLGVIPPKYKKPEPVAVEEPRPIARQEPVKPPLPPGYAYEPPVTAATTQPSPPPMRNKPAAPPPPYTPKQPLAPIEKPITETPAPTATTPVAITPVTMESTTKQPATIDNQEKAGSMLYNPFSEIKSWEDIAMLTLVSLSLLGFILITLWIIKKIAQFKRFIAGLFKKDVKEEYEAPKQSQNSHQEPSFNRHFEREAGDVHVTIHLFNGKEYKVKATWTRGPEGTFAWQLPFKHPHGAWIYAKDEGDCKRRVREFFSRALVQRKTPGAATQLQEAVKNGSVTVSS